MMVPPFLTMGSANRRLYEGYGVPPTAIRSAPYCVDNDRFAAQAAELFPQRAELRRRWHIPDEAFCVLFCGKFIAKKRPLEMLQALDMIGPKLDDGRPVHVLFVGSGELGGALRTSCRVVFDADSPNSANPTDGGPAASFAGFMNQSQIAAAYVAADLLVLPSDFGETWGLVVNEAMACGTPAAVSDQCGCAEDLPAHLAPELVFHCGAADDMARAIQFAAHARWSRQDVQRVADRCHLRRTVDAAAELYRELLERR